MKKQVFLGLAAIMAAASVQAAPNARRVSPEALEKGVTEYESTVKRYFEQQKSKGNDALRESIATLLEFKVDGNERQALSKVLSGPNGEKAIQQLGSLIAGKQIDKKLKEKGQSDESFSNSVDAMTETILNMQSTRTQTASKTLEPNELADATLALERLESITGRVIKMESSARDAYSAVERKRSELLKTTGMSGEEALVEAIMQTRKVSKEEAMKIVRRMKECV